MSQDVKVLPNSPVRVCQLRGTSQQIKGLSSILLIQCKSSECMRYCTLLVSFVNLQGNKESARSKNRANWYKYGPKRLFNHLLVILYALTFLCKQTFSYQQLKANYQRDRIGPQYHTSHLDQLPLRQNLRFKNS